MSERMASVIGLGAMGHQMARHLLNKGFNVSGVDVSEPAAKKASAIGVRVLSSVADAGANAQCVIVMVATDKQVEDVIIGSGLLDSMMKGSVICVSSSTAVGTAQSLEKMCAEKEIHILDTPVVLGQEAADNGTLTAFCGGTGTAFEKARPFLQAFAANVIHVGSAGMGQLCKTVNNMLLWACLTANYEALTFAKAMGADIPKMLEALKYSSGANWSLNRWGKSSGKWAEKDMDVAIEMAQHVKVPVPMAALVDQLMKGMNQEKMKALLV